MPPPIPTRRSGVSWSPMSPSSALAASTGSSLRGDRATRERRIASMRESHEPSYMHSFALTERYAVLVAFPSSSTHSAWRLSGRPFIENYKWKPELGTKVLVFDRNDGGAPRHLRGGGRASPSTTSTPSSARAELTILTCPPTTTATIIDSFYLERLRTGNGRPPSPCFPVCCAIAQPRRRRASPRKRSARFPSSCRGSTTVSCNGRPYRYAYGVGGDRRRRARIREPRGQDRRRERARPSSGMSPAAPRRAGFRASPAAGRARGRRGAALGRPRRRTRGAPTCSSSMPRPWAS